MEYRVRLGSWASLCAVATSALASVALGQTTCPLAEEANRAIGCELDSTASSLRLPTAEEKSELGQLGLPPNGTLVFDMEDLTIADGDGADFVVYEQLDGHVMMRVAAVAVSDDGVSYVSAGWGNLTADARGFTFDLAGTGLARAHHVAVAATINGGALDDDAVVALNVHMDADGDGLELCSELAIGTAPRTLDTDGDGLGDGFEVASCGSDPLDADSDADSVGDAGDNCPLIANTAQEDLDGDGHGDACDPDDDGDGVDDGADSCPGTVAGTGVDADGCELPEAFAPSCGDVHDDRGSGRYLMCIVAQTRQAQEAGLITKEARAALCKQAILAVLSQIFARLS